MKVHKKIKVAKNHSIYEINSIKDAIHYIERDDREFTTEIKIICKNSKDNTIIKKVLNKHGFEWMSGMNLFSKDYTKEKYLNGIGYLLHYSKKVQCDSPYMSSRSKIILVYGKASHLNKDGLIY